MKTLTHNQKEYLLLHFFKNEAYPGWENIARKLLDKGKCIVPGNKCIWNGGIGNFIKTSDDVGDVVGCILYTFDLDYFLTSLWYKEYTELYTAELHRKKSVITAEYNDIINLTDSQ